MKKHMTVAEWNKIYEMSKDKNIRDNLINSLFPSIHGNDQVKKGDLLVIILRSFFNLNTIHSVHYSAMLK